MKEKKKLDKTKPSDGMPIYPEGYFEQLRILDMLMVEISRELPAPPCCEDMFPMIEQCSDKEFVKGYYKKRGKIKNGRSRQC